LRIETKLGYPFLIGHIWSCLIFTDQVTAKTINTIGISSLQANVSPLNIIGDRLPSLEIFTS
jgi:hypothetical protein